MPLNYTPLTPSPSPAVAPGRRAPRAAHGGGGDDILRQVHAERCGAGRRGARGAGSASHAPHRRARPAGGRRGGVGHISEGHLWRSAPPRIHRVRVPCFLRACYGCLIVRSTKTLDILLALPPQFLRREARSCNAGCVERR